MVFKPARDTRAQLLDAAEAVVAQHGVRNLTLDAVAARSGISKGGLLYHFRSKEDLAAAMIERSIAWFDDALVEAGRLRSPYSMRSIPVELVLWAHLGTWTRLCLEPQRRVHVGRAYFRKGHRVLDALSARLISEL